MKKQEILEWLNQLIKLHKELLKMQEKFEEKGVRFCKCDNIHVAEGIEYYADAVGAVVTESTFAKGDFPYRYSFVYGGVEIFQISEQELSLEVHWDED